MSDRDRQFQHESLQDSRALAEYLKALIQGFESGTLRLRDPEGEIELEPRGLVSFEVRATQKRGRSKLHLRFSWKEDSPRVAGTLEIEGDDS